MKKPSITLELINYHLRLDNFPAAWSYYRSLQHTLTKSEKAILKARILEKQGLLAQAHTSLLLDSPLFKNSDGLEWKRTLNRLLLNAFLRAEVDNELQETKQIFDLLQDSKSIGSLALTCSVIGKLLMLGLQLQRLPIQAQADALTWWNRAAQFYWEAGDNFAALELELRCISLVNKQSVGEESDIEARLESIISRAQHYQLPLVSAEAQLLKLELKASPSRTQVDDDCRQIFENFRKAHSPLGAGKVYQFLGKFVYSQAEDGSLYLEKALFIYDTLGAFRHLYSAYADYGLQLLQLGKLDEAMEAYNKRLDLANKMGYPIAQIPALMGIGECFHRRAQFGQSIYYYKRAEQLTVKYNLLALYGLNLANVYSQMNRQEKALQLATSVIPAIRYSQNPSNLSLAYFILANLQIASRQWEDAISTWELGLELDQEYQNLEGMAQKLAAKAWTLAQQWYEPAKHLSVEQFNALQPYFRQALDCIVQIPVAQQRIALKADLFQLMANVAIFAHRYDLAVEKLELVASYYEQIDHRMEAANTWVMLGLLGLQLGNAGRYDLWQNAIAAFIKALNYFETAQMLGFTWKIKYYLADLVMAIGRKSLEPDNQMANWQNADLFIHAAADDITHIRREYSDENSLETDAGKIGLVADKTKLFGLGIKLHLHYFFHPAQAFFWLEQLKSRALHDLLAASEARLKVQDFEKEASPGALEDVTPEKPAHFWKLIQQQLC